MTAGQHRRIVDPLEAFQGIARLLTSTLELDEVLQVMADRLSRTLGAERWSLLLERDDGFLHFVLAQGDGAERLRGEVVVPGEGIAGIVFATGEPKLSADVRHEPGFAERFDVMTGVSTGALLAVPLTVRGRRLGVLELVSSHTDEGAFTADDLRAAGVVADFAAIAIDNARNYRQVQALTLTDEHTGLGNARHLHALLEAEVARCASFGRPLSVLFFDIDDFKHVNDTRGHLVGSASLKHAGHLLKSCIRGIDTGFRFGGDEFAALLVETGPDEARDVGRRVVEAFRHTPFQPPTGAPVPLSISLGFASFPDDGQTPRALLEAADGAMYRVKRSGKDGVGSRR